jgi:glycerol-3-phosphate dehydrogenase (NAD(P)+)
VGYTVKSAMMEMSMVSEGYYATKAPTISIKIRRENVIDAVYQILYEGKDAKRTFKELTDKLD